MDNLTKKCTKCGEVKGLDYFRKHETAKYYRNSICKECEKEYNRKWRVENREKINESNRKWKERNPEKAKKNSVESSRRSVESLSYSYIKGILKESSIPVTSETIELKREIITVKRIKSKLKNHVTEKNIRTTE